jgi:hypothetical protein
MRILFYSESCNFCLKLLEYINKNNLEQYFKMICIDEKTAKVPKHITIVPTVIDTTIESPMEGKKAFEYVINQKYFNHPTNNIEYTKNGIPIPTIEEDSKAASLKSGSGFIYVDKDIEKKFIEKEDKNNFEQVFNFNQYSPQIKNSQTQDNRVNQLIEQRNSQAQDNRVNQLIEQRNIQDKRMQSLIRLRK